LIKYSTQLIFMYHAFFHIFQQLPDIFLAYSNNLQFFIHLKWLCSSEVLDYNLTLYKINFQLN